MEKKLVCPCGLTCCDCLFYKSEIYDAARKLKELIKINDLDLFLTGNSRKTKWKSMAEHMMLTEDQEWEQVGQYFDVFKDIPLFMNVLDGIIKLQCKDTCKETGGCSLGGNLHECHASKCVKSNGYDGCWQCEKFENCDKLSFVKKNYGYVIEENLRTAKEKGIEEVKSHGNRYYTWQRKKYGDAAE
jgi:hypothetical protein